MYALATEVGEEQRLDARFVNENQRFKSRHPMYLRRASYGSLLLWLLVFLFSPVYCPKPYDLPSETIQVLEVARELVIPPPPKDIPSPVLPPEIAIDPLVQEEFNFFEQPIDGFVFPALPRARPLEPGVGRVYFDTKPVILERVSPVYPETARDMGLEGQVLVNVLVGVDGRPRSAEVVRSAHPILDREALRAAGQFLFSPGRQGEHAVEVWVTLPFTFRIH